MHVIALIPQKLDIADLEAIRTAATQAAQFQRMERDLALAYREGRGAAPQQPVARTVYPTSRAYQVLEEPIRRVKTLRSVNVCHLCGKRVGKGYAKCYNCGAILEITLDLGDNGLGY